MLLEICDSRMKFAEIQARTAKSILTDMVEANLIHENEFGFKHLELPRQRRPNVRQVEIGDPLPPPPETYDSVNQMVYQTIYYPSITAVLRELDHPFLPRFHATFSYAP